MVYSKEKPITPNMEDYTAKFGDNKVIGSTPFVPSVMGLILANEVAKDIVKN